MAHFFIVSLATGGSGAKTGHQAYVRGVSFFTLPIQGVRLERGEKPTPQDRLFSRLQTKDKESAPRKKADLLFSVRVA